MCKNLLFVAIFFAYLTDLRAERIPLTIKVAESGAVEKFGDPMIVEFVDGWGIINVPEEESRYTSVFLVRVTLDEENGPLLVEFTKKNLEKEIEIYLKDELISKALLIKANTDAVLRVNFESRERFEDVKRRIGIILASE